MRSATQPTKLIDRWSGPRPSRNQLSEPASARGFPAADQPTNSEPNLMSAQEVCTDCDPSLNLPTTTDAPLSGPPPDLPKPTSTPQLDTSTFSPPKLDNEVPRVIVEVR